MQMSCRSCSDLEKVASYVVGSTYITLENTAPLSLPCFIFAPTKPGPCSAERWTEPRMSEFCRDLSLIISQYTRAILCPAFHPIIRLLSYRKDLGKELVE